MLHETLFPLALVHGLCFALWCMKMSAKIGDKRQKDRPRYLANQDPEDAIMIQKQQMFYSLR